MAVQDVAKSARQPPAMGDHPNMMPQAFVYSPVRFLQVMLAIAWSALAHPFTSSVIELTTGQVYPTEEK
jgi:hypothetical protein